MTTNGDDGPLQVTAETRIGDVPARYGDIADVMESLGVKRVGRFDVRRLVGKILTVRWAAKAHGLPLDEMVRRLQTAIDQVHRTQAKGS